LLDDFVFHALAEARIEKQNIHVELVLC